MDQAVDEDTPEGPIFFLSYAHGPRSDLMKDFFNALSAHVQQLFGLSADLVGFMDDSTLTPSERWSDSVMVALGTCRVFVPLISTAYVRSRWCAREWHAFHRRTMRSLQPGRNTTPVLPLLWSPLSEDATPPEIRNVQMYLPREEGSTDFRRSYLRDGLYGLCVTQHDSYETLVWRIAQEILRIDAEHRVEPGIVTDPIRLSASFWNNE